MNELSITPAQRQAVLDMLGLDPDLTLSLSISSDWVNAQVADVDGEGQVRMEGGRLVSVSLSGPVRDPEPEPEPEPEADSPDVEAAS